MEDYYQVLGIPRTATPDQIKQAYRKLVRASHPDVNPSPEAAEWTRQLNEAYGVLSDPDAKSSYDADLELEESKQQDVPREDANSHREQSVQGPGFWERLRKLKLHPVFYHAPGVVFAVILLSVGWRVMKVGSSTEPSRSGTSYQQVGIGIPNEPVSRTFSQPEEPLPAQGALQISDWAASHKGQTAPLRISTRESGGHHVMKVVDWNTGQFQGAYFIHRGTALTIELPLGSYRLKFASGEKWYGLKNLFGPETTYSCIPDPMDFYISGNYASGHGIELTPQAGDKLETRRMKAAEW